MEVKIEIRGYKEFHYYVVDIPKDEILDLIDGGYSVCCAQTNKCINRMTLYNVVYLDKIEPKEKSK